MKRLVSVTESYVGQEERERTRRKRLGPQIHKLLGHTLETERARGRSVILTEERDMDLRYTSYSVIHRRLRKQDEGVTESYVGEEERERTRRKRLGPQIHELLRLLYYSGIYRRLREHEEGV